MDKILPLAPDGTIDLGTYTAKITIDGVTTDYSSGIAQTVQGMYESGNWEGAEQYKYYMPPNNNNG